MPLYAGARRPAASTAARPQGHPSWAPIANLGQRGRNARSAFALYGAWRTAVWHLRRALQRDSPCYGEMTMRAALVFQLHNAATVARRDARFPALAEVAGRVSARLQDRLGEAAARVPQWPAFARGAGHRASGTC